MGSGSRTELPVGAGPGGVGVGSSMHADVLISNKTRIGHTRTRRMLTPALGLSGPTDGLGSGGDIVIVFRTDTTPLSGGATRRPSAGRRFGACDDVDDLPEQSI